MTTLYILGGIIVVVVIGLAVLKALFEGDNEQEKAKYQYKRRNFFLTRAEHECYDALVSAVGAEYFVFAQVHLPTLVDNKVKGQNWRGAFSCTSVRSPWILCCAIRRTFLQSSLLSWTTKRTNAQSGKSGDREVERILQEAGEISLRGWKIAVVFNPTELYSKNKRHSQSRKWSQRRKICYNIRVVH